MISLCQYIEHLGANIMKVSGGSDERIIVGATNDSRKVKSGWLFVAVSGFLDDGHRYLDKALATGATVIVSERELELPASVVGEKTMVKLHELDGVAYVRFASVYREFKDVNDFVSELKSLLSSNGKTEDK